MRDPAPLVSDQRIRHHITAKILLVQVQIEIAQDIGRQRRSLLRHCVGPALKFLEHGLAVDCPFKALEIMIEKIGSLCRVFRTSKQILQKEDLIGGRGDFRHEDPVLGIQM